jgi:hypothetical protein
MKNIMNYQKTQKTNGTIEFAFQSKNIPGSPIGLLAAVIPAGFWLAWKILLWLNPNMQGGGLFAVLVLISAVLIVGGYILLKNIIFLKSHTFIVNRGQSIMIDGKLMSYSQFKGFGTNKKDEQASIYMKKDGREVKLTGWMDAERAEEVVEVLVKR